MKTIIILCFAIATSLVSCTQGDESIEDLSLKEFEIITIDSTYNELVIKSLIKEELNENELINIAYSEKIKRKWENKLIFYFFLNSTSNPAYATALYLKDCSQCNYTDPSNSKINLNFNIGQASQNTAFEIPKEISKDLLVVEFYEESWKSRSFIVYDNDKKREATKIMYFEDGGINKQKLIAESENLFRVIIDGFPEDKPYFRINGEIVEYVYSDGKIGNTYSVIK